MNDFAELCALKQINGGKNCQKYEFIAYYIK